MVSKQLSNVFFQRGVTNLGINTAVIVYCAVTVKCKSTESSKFLCYGPLQIFVKTTAT